MNKNDLDSQEGQKKAQSARFKRLLEEKNIKESALAKAATISPGHLNQMKNGLRPLNSKLLTAIAYDPALGHKAVFWILKGEYEQELFSPANNHAAGEPERTLGSLIQESGIPPYSLSQENAFQELRVAIDEPALALKIAKALIFICKYDRKECRRILKDILGIYDLLQYEQEKKRKGEPC